MLTLGALIDDGNSRPAFRGEANGQAIRVDFDTSALLKLGDGASGQDLHAAIDAQRGPIRLAAQRLYNERFFSPNADGLPQIIISAIDLI
jgi:hypothetical protein